MNPVVMITGPGNNRVVELPLVQPAVLLDDPL